MSDLQTKIISYVKKNIWSILSLFLALVGILMGIPSLFPERPNLVFDVRSEISLVDIHDKSGKIDVFYDGESIKKSGVKVLLESIRIMNKGTAPIEESDFPEKEIVGFTIKGGSVIDEPVVTNSSRESLKSIPLIKMRNKTEIDILPVLMNPDDFFDIKLVVLNEKTSGSGIEILPRGAIPRAPKISVIPIRNAGQGESATIHLLELIHKTTEDMVLAFIGTILIYGVFSYYRQRKNTSKLFSEYEKSDSFVDSPWNKWIQEEFPIFQKTLLYSTYRFLSDSERVKKAEEYLEKNPTGKIPESVPDHDHIKTAKIAIDKGATFQELRDAVLPYYNYLTDSKSK